MAEWCGRGPERGSACFVTASSGDRRAIQQRWSAAGTADGPPRRRSTGSCIAPRATAAGPCCLPDRSTSTVAPSSLLARHASSADLCDISGIVDASVKSGTGWLGHPVDLENCHTTPRGRATEADRRSRPRLPPGHRVVGLREVNGMPDASSVLDLYGRRVPLLTMVLDCSSRNGSKDAMGSGRTGWTEWDGKDSRPWPGGSPQNPIRRMGRVPFAS